MACARKCLLAVILIGVADAAAAQVASAARCDQLLAFYERYAGRITHGLTPGGRLERELGDQECRRGNHAAGIWLLEDAIRKIGYPVPAG